MGGTLLTTGSILAAFFAGAVALFSPCCIVFLFPAYLASAVKNRRWTLLPLTFVFALGLAAVLLPVTLGIGLVMTSVRRFHTELYVVGGLLMLGLRGPGPAGPFMEPPSGSSVAPPLRVSSYYSSMALQIGDPIRYDPCSF